MFSLSLCPIGFFTLRLAVVLDSFGPCFKTGRVASFRRCPHPEREPSPPGFRILQNQTATTGTASAEYTTRRQLNRHHTTLTQSASPRDGFRYFSPSFQSAFHLSLTVLVRYRSPTSILDLDEVYHLLEQRSQATRLG